MPFISISNLRPSGSDLFVDDENFMSEISENELDSIIGGYATAIGIDDWCGNGKTKFSPFQPDFSPYPPRLNNFNNSAKTGVNVNT